MGVAEIIPGVSGSTIALAMGIYDNFINFLHSISQLVKVIVTFVIGKASKADIIEAFKDINFKFGVALVFGMTAANLLLSNVMDLVLKEYPNYTQALFFGLVIASITVPYSEMKLRNAKTFGLIIISAIVTFFILGLRAPTFTESPDLIFFFLAGLAGMSGMIIPGVSGSFILLMMGVYEHIIAVIKNISRLSPTGDDIARFLAFNFGLFLGFVFFVRILKWAFVNYSSQVLAVLIGLMIGSLRVIYPFFSHVDGEGRTPVLPFEQTANYNILIVYVMIFIGGFAVVILNKLKVDRQQVEQIQEGESVEDNE